MEQVFQAAGAETVGTAGVKARQGHQQFPPQAPFHRVQGQGAQEVGGPLLHVQVVQPLPPGADTDQPRGLRPGRARQAGHAQQQQRAIDDRQGFRRRGKGGDEGRPVRPVPRRRDLQPQHTAAQGGMGDQVGHGPGGRPGAEQGLPERRRAIRVRRHRHPRPDPGRVLFHLLGHRRRQARRGMLRQQHDGVTARAQAGDNLRDKAIRSGQRPPVAPHAGRLTPPVAGPGRGRAATGPRPPA